MGRSHQIIKESGRLHSVLKMVAVVDVKTLAGEQTSPLGFLGNHSFVRQGFRAL